MAIFVHSFQGAATDLCLVKVHLMLMFPYLECYCSKTNGVRTLSFTVVIHHVSVTHFAKPVPVCRYPRGCKGSDNAAANWVVMGSGQ